MSANIGEVLVASYFQHIAGCEFVQTNLYTVDSQGEIDVVAINLAERKVYIAEVATHLTTGLQYTAQNKTNNVNKLTEKFVRDIAYAERFFPDYERQYMLWSPIVKGGRRSPENHQLQHLEHVGQNIRELHGVEIEFVVNERFQARLMEMRAYARKATADLKCPVMRLFQIEEWLGKHVVKLEAQ